MEAVSAAVELGEKVIVLGLGALQRIEEVPYTVSVRLPANIRALEAQNTPKEVSSASCA